MSVLLSMVLSRSSVAQDDGPPVLLSCDLRAEGKGVHQLVRITGANGDARSDSFSASGHTCVITSFVGDANARYHLLTCKRSDGDEYGTELRPDASTRKLPGNWKAFVGRLILPKGQVGGACYEDPKVRRTGMK